MKVLIACEESQEVCKAFRALGHEAYSCDIQEPSGGHPEWHIMGDALKAIEGGQVTTMDKQTHNVGKWDLLIAHPPCTYLTVTGNRWFNTERYGEKAVRRLQLREEFETDKHCRCRRYFARWIQYGGKRKLCKRGGDIKHPPQSWCYVEEG